MPGRASGADSGRLEVAWAARVRANREQVDRVRRGPEGDDFYAPVSTHFLADPYREGDEVLEALRRLARRDDTWLDIGAGAGRYALPLALAVSEVVALDPSAAMLAALRQAMTRHGIKNVRVIEGRWPESSGPGLRADVALIAQVGYDVERIGPFLDAMDDAVRRLCVAVMMERSPASAADGFWPPVHGVKRIPLPALPELLEILRARGVEPSLAWVERSPPRFDSPDETLAYLRQQLWAIPGDAADSRLLDEIALRRDRGWDGVSLDGGPTRLAIAAWASPPRGPRV